MCLTNILQKLLITNTHKKRKTVCRGKQLAQHKHCVKGKHKKKNLPPKEH